MQSIQLTVEHRYASNLRLSWMKKLVLARVVRLEV